ncbi:MAG: hypothetical protein ACTHZ9_00760, partial [Leucobacter sp.]
MTAAKISISASSAAPYVPHIVVVGAGIVGLAHAVAGVETRVSGTLVVARTSVEEQGLQELTRGNGVDERGLLAGSAAAELLGIDADHAPIAAALLPH